jgi:hypothetical protein
MKEMSRFKPPVARSRQVCSFVLLIYETPAKEYAVLLESL